MCQRENEIFQRCIGAQAGGDENYAKIYANECAEIRKMFLTTKSVQLALEKVMVRLDTIVQFGETIIELAPILEVVRQTKSEIAGVVPDVASELDKITSILGDLSSEAGQVTPTNLEIKVTTEEARKILEASKRIADEKAREKFPTLPLLMNEAIQPEVKTNNQINDKLPTSFLEQVLCYIKSHAGKVSINECASELSRTPNDVIKAIDQLKEEGKFDVEWEDE